MCSLFVQFSVFAGSEGIGTPGSGEVYKNVV